MDLNKLQTFPTRARLCRQPRGQRKPILTVNADFLRPENSIEISEQEYLMLLERLRAGKTDFFKDDEGRLYTIMADNKLFVAPAGFRLDPKNAI